VTCNLVALTDRGVVVATLGRVAYLMGFGLLGIAVTARRLERRLLH
jgi:hypothetical protein